MVRTLSCYAKIAGLTPGQGTYKNQSINEPISETTIDVPLDVVDPIASENINAIFRKQKKMLFLFSLFFLLPS